MAKNGAKNEDVTSFRHALVEFDRDDGGTPIPKEQQHAAILASGLPVSALIDSGNKSLHAWVRVDAPDAAEYRRRVDIIWDWFEGRCLDRQNKNPSRLSRCPEGRRTVDGEVRAQQLLALACRREVVGRMGSGARGGWSAEDHRRRGVHGGAEAGAAAAHRGRAAPGRQDDPRRREQERGSRGRSST